MDKGYKVLWALERKSDCYLRRTCGMAGPIPSAVDVSTTIPSLLLETSREIWTDLYVEHKKHFVLLCHYACPLMLL